MSKTLTSSIAIEDITLLDDGTLDTVIGYCSESMAEPIEIRFSDTSFYREEDGSFSSDGWHDFCENEVVPAIEETIYQ